MLSIPLDDRRPPLGLTPAATEGKNPRSAPGLARRLAHRQAVLFTVEDLHWADPTTLEFLQILVEQVQGDRLLSVLTFRPEFTLPWRARAQLTQVSLNRLTRRQTGELMLTKSGFSRIPQDVLDQVAERTDGVPLFVEEFTAMLLEAGACAWWTAKCRCRTPLTCMPFRPLCKTS